VKIRQQLTVKNSFKKEKLKIMPINAMFAKTYIAVTTTKT